jgi:hypothetical protein
MGSTLLRAEILDLCVGVLFDRYACVKTIGIKVVFMLFSWLIYGSCPAANDE